MLAGIAILAFAAVAACGETAGPESSGSGTVATARDAYLSCVNDLGLTVDELVLEPGS